jgi:hypothetical protein
MHGSGAAPEWTEYFGPLYNNPQDVGRAAETWRTTCCDFPEGGLSRGGDAFVYRPERPDLVDSGGSMAETRHKLDQPGWSAGFAEGKGPFFADDPARWQSPSGFRFTWLSGPGQDARWEQAFSADGGANVGKYPTGRWQFQAPVPSG